MRMKKVKSKRLPHQSLSLQYKINDDPKLPKVEKSSNSLKHQSINKKRVAKLKLKKAKSRRTHTTLKNSQTSRL